jgi:hypothetical protein
MKMPRPTDAHEKLAALAGEWEGPEVLAPGPGMPDERQARGHFDNRIDLDGFYLINNYTEEREGEVIMRGHGVYGYDPHRERYTMHWFDSMGFPPREILGRWDNAALTFEAQSEKGWARYIYQILNNDRFTFSILVSTDGEQWQPLMEGTYDRISEA